MKNLVFLLLCIFVVSCVTVHSNEMSYAQDQRLQWQEAAKAGNAEAQFQLGNAYCCGDEGRFFDTNEAVKWWCKAAKQSHEGAKFQIVQYNATRQCL